MKVNKCKLFSKLVFRALLYRKIHTIVAMLAIVLGTSVIGGMVNLNFNINDKMSKEFRAYGANVLIYPSDQKIKITMEKVNEINRKISSHKLIGIAPMHYSIVQIEKKPVVLAGTWLDQMKKVSPYWSVDGSWISKRNDVKEAMVGVNIANKFEIKPGSIIRILNQDNKSTSIKVKGIVTSGGKEDNQIFVDEAFAEKITNKQTADIILLSLLEKGSKLNKETSNLQTSISGIKVQPIKQMEQSEEKMLIKIQQLIRLISIIIFMITILTVSTTLISMINERRKEVGLKKAIGASNKKLLLEFLAEGSIICLIGSTIGIIGAFYLAQLIGRSVFNSEISFQVSIIPWTYITALIIVAISFFIPVRKIMEVDPAIILKGN